MNPNGISLEESIGYYEAYHDAHDDFPHSPLDCSICEEAAAFHDACNTRWADHDNSYLGAVLPFGCLPELELRRRWGDR